jgi:hypothetical protein
VHTDKSKRGRKPKLLTAWGESKSISQWAEDPRATVSVRVIYTRLYAGYTPEEAISRPKQSCRTRPRPATQPRRARTRLIAGPIGALLPPP